MNIYWILEFSKEFQKKVNLCLTDRSKAFDRMDHEKLCVVLKEKVVLQHLIVLRRNLFGGQEATVRPEYGETNWLPVGEGVRPGCILSAYMFNLHEEHTIRKAELDSEEGGVNIYRI